MTTKTGAMMKTSELFATQLVAFQAARDALDRRADDDGVDPPAGRITRNGAIVETTSAELTDAVDSGDLPGIQGPPQIGSTPRP
ncbi:hypothetical protein [Acidipropionibacterium acidipropionici]|nr:hypothetical protein [Acidipropionibacterium acidipropionici]ALN15037.1 hypothetical protein ASQ49_06870 [Acidipropionibacterium acidipropionici]APZ09211.1 hypothetical protein BWX38_08055 [Acidipropionibacterium acidipropionici]